MNEESQNLNETTESVPSFLQEGLDDPTQKNSKKKKKDPEDVFNQDSGSDDQESDEEENPMTEKIGPDYAYHRGLYTLNVAERVT